MLDPLAFRYCMTSSWLALKQPSKNERTPSSPLWHSWQMAFVNSSSSAICKCQNIISNVIIACKSYFVKISISYAMWNIFGKYLNHIELHCNTLILSELKQTALLQWWDDWLSLADALTPTSAISIIILTPYKSNASFFFSFPFLTTLTTQFVDYFFSGKF